MRETLVKPLGLVTEPNKYGVYPPGALSQATNVHMRSPGTLTQLPRSTALASAPGPYSPERLFSTGAQLLVFEDDVPADWAIVWVEPDGTQTTATFEDTFAGMSPFNSITIAGHGCITPILFRSRTLVNGDHGIIVADYVDPQTTDERMFRYANLAQPLLYATANIAGQAIDPNDVVTYSCLLQRTYEDGYILISEPAPLLRVKNLAVTISGATVTVRWDPTARAPSGSGVRAGDEIELYRSPPVASPTAGLDTNSGNVLYHVQTHVITSAEVAVGHAVLEDTSGETAWGKELYTNPGAEAAQAPRRRPPAAMSCATFKGCAFYSNLTYPPLWVVSWPGGFGNLTTAESREHGVGARSISGTFNAGVNPTIITAITAADLVGVVPGQYLTGTAFPTASGSARVVSVGATSITMSVPATLSGVKTFSAVDVLELDGVEFPIASLASLLRQLCAGASDIAGEPPPLSYTIVTEPTVTYEETPGSTIFNQRMALGPQQFPIATVTVRGTHGENYDPPIPQLTETVKTIERTREPNLTTWSWIDQPEAVAPPNSTSIGYGEIYASVATRDALWFHTSDGLYRLTGYATRSSGVGAQWRVDLIDRTLVLASPLAYTVLRDQVFSHTNRGLVEVTDSGARELSTGIIGDILPPARMEPDAAVDYFLEADDENDEVWVFARDADGEDVEFFIYSVRAQAFTTCDGPNVFAPFARVFGFVDFLHSMVFALANEDVFDQNFLYYFVPGDTMATIETFVDFQAISAGDPMTAKQWIDMTLLFEASVADELSATNVTPRFNGSSTSTAINFHERPNDARGICGVPRSAPAIGHTLAPGYATNTGGDPKPLTQFYGLSLRFEILSDQQVFR